MSTETLRRLARRGSTSTALGGQPAGTTVPHVPQHEAMRGKVPDVFRYLDYRAYLGAYYVAKKKASPTFSYRAFARRAGLKAPNHLKRVTDGERNLSDESAVRYADALALSDDEAAYFCELVRFTQARVQSEKSASYRRLTQFRGYRRAHRLDRQQDRYHSEWYIPAIRELLGHADFRADPAWIASHLVPTITEKQANEALEVLIELGMLRRRKNGEVERADQVVSTGPETSLLHVVHYHRAMMDRAMESIDIVPKEQRDISGVTLCIREDTLPKLKERLQSFRKEIISMEAAEGEGERVVHLGIQLFPLSTPGRDR